MNEQSARLFKKGLSVPDSLCTATPSPQKKSEKGCLWGGRDCTETSQTDNLISSSSVKTANNKITESSVFNDSKGLYGTTVCRCLVRRPHYSARLMLFGSRGPSEFATKMPGPRLRGKAPGGVGHGPKGIIGKKSKTFALFTSLVTP